MFIREFLVNTCLTPVLSLKNQVFAYIMCVFNLQEAIV